MPPFKLETCTPPSPKRIPTMLYCKKEYHPKVKVEHWNMYMESQPWDKDPYNPQCFRLHESHYTHLGSYEKPDYSTETSQAFKPFKSFSREGSCKETDKSECCHSSDYLTTMQESYSCPYPCVIKGLEMPKGIVQKHKRMKGGDNCKFLDDDFTSFTRSLQKVKG